MEHDNTRHMAIDATLHCLTGCALGEIIGLVIGTILSLSNMPTIILSIGLAFMFGYSLSLLPLLRSGLPVATALGVAFAADTLSIATMEVIDNTVMAAIPGAMGAGIVNPLFWSSMAVATVAAFLAAVPVNEFLLKRGAGHAVAHKYHNHGKEQ